MKILKKLMKPFHRKIKTPEEYEASMKLFSALMDKGENPSFCDVGTIETPT